MRPVIYSVWEVLPARVLIPNAMLLIFARLCILANA